MLLIRCSQMCQAKAKTETKIIKSDNNEVRLKQNEIRDYANQSDNY